MRESDTERSSARGKLIVIEGIDGTGKTTLAAALVVALRERGVDVVLSFEPTNGPHGKRIREQAKPGGQRLAPEAELAEFMADRKEHVRDVIEPALAAGRWVVLDRYYYSTMAYQGARGLDPEAIERQNQAFAPEPDILVVLDLSVTRALERVTQNRGDVPDAFETEELLEKTQAIFSEIRHPRMIRLDACASTDNLVQQVCDAL